MTNEDEKRERLRRYHHAASLKFQASFKTDGFTRGGAEKLAQRIRDYWHRRGFDVEVRVEPAETGFVKALRTGDWFVVRSDLVNGWPVRRLAK